MTSVTPNMFTYSCGNEIQVQGHRQKAEEKEEAKNEGQKPESPENDEESAEGDGATAEKETDAKPEAAEEKTEEEEKKLGGEGRKKSFRATFGGGLFLGVRFLTYGFVLAHFT
ncbi:UNVERIFIED_CONTAM: hypothetical protein PYX00_000056 [Menopon gallinae]|uniref:Uncharacterized protein n=1 Tax=Menopon gallinae TaxID=328185 RepID=A0AAW2I8P6_9NEOP